MKKSTLVIDGSDCDITAAATCVANTATNSGAAVVTLNSGTATVNDGLLHNGNELSEAEMETLVNALAYKNNDDISNCCQQQSRHNYYNEG